ncbi:MAG: hypothetical protein E4G98_04320 [Promethearchaeota archaeon]|nr:MAG: hypothetical protein E4G98_04320 [Candidatus Lokiarchaeota archaeon]
MNNQETIIRENYIATELLKIALLQQDGILVGKFAWKIFANAQKLKDLEKQIKYYRIALKGFKDAQNEAGHAKTWKNLLKAGKLAKTETLLPLQAEIWEDYGNFLLQQQTPTSKVAKYFEKARKIYIKLNNTEKVAVLDHYIQSIGTQ